MADQDAPQKRSLILRLGAVAGAIAAISGVVFTFKPGWKPKEPPTPQVTPPAGVTAPPIASASPSGTSVGPSPSPGTNTFPSISVRREPDAEALRAEIRAQYDEIDAALVQQGMMGLFTKLSSDWKTLGDEGTVTSKSEAMQYVQGEDEKLKLVGITVKMERVETALELVMPQSDGPVVASVMRKMTITTASSGSRKEHTDYERVADTWKKENGRRLIVRTEKEQ